MTKSGETDQSDEKQGLADATPLHGGAGSAVFGAAIRNRRVLAGKVVSDWLRANPQRTTEDLMLL